MKNFIVNKLTSLTRVILNQSAVKSALSEIVSDCIRREIRESENQNELWKATNIRPNDGAYQWSRIPNSIREDRMNLATRQASEFIHENIPHLEGMPNSFETLRVALDAVSVSDGLYAEFGVFSGASINYIAKEIGPDKVIHGFDSFEGLPEDWGTASKGTFDTGGVLPTVADNVRLHKGWFEDTIDEFLSQHSGPAAFIHADADLYSSTKTILSKLKDRIIKGTVIVFDEYLNYPYWKDHEYKAFTEFVNEHSLEFEYIAYSDRGFSVAVKMK